MLELPTTENPMITEEEVQRLLRKCEHYGCSATSETRDGGHLAVTVTGAQVRIINDNAKRWCPNVIVQGCGQPNSIVLVWEAGTFVSPEVKLPTKREGTLADATVLSRMTRQQIDTLNMLQSVLKQLDADIEEAYPNTRLANSGVGAGKRDLVIKVMDRLHELSSRNVPQFLTYVALRLGHHFQVEDPAEKLIIPEPARASARAR